MSIKITKKALEGYLKRSLFEDSYVVTDEESYSPMPTIGAEYADAEEVPDIFDAPVDASEQMATQLSDVKPPIEDDTYRPSNPIELGLASNAIGRLIPDGQVEYFYQRLKDVWDETEEKAANPEVIIGDEEMEIKKLHKNESHSIKQLRHQLTRLIEQTEFDEEEEYDEFRHGYGTVDPAEEDDEALTLSQVEEIEGMGLDDLAAKFGYSAASGVRQSLERILGRLNFTMENVDESELTAIKQTAVSEFVELLSNEGYIEPEDASELLANPGEVETLDSFRFFLVGGFLLPAYQGILRNTRKRVEGEIERLGLPQRSAQTVLHQVFGDTPKNLEKLRKKILRDADKEGMDSQKAVAIADKATTAFSHLSNLAKVEGDLVSTSLDAWNKAGGAKKKKILKQALESTAGHQEEFGK